MSLLLGCFEPATVVIEGAVMKKAA